MINNKHMLDDRYPRLNMLKTTLVEHFDYEVVPQSVWQHLYSWYSADVTICRRLKKDKHEGSVRDTESELNNGDDLAFSMA